jgi:hypothetical protein
MFGPTHRRRFALLAAGLWLGLLGSVATAQVAGEVEFSRGVGFAQTAGQAPRTLGRGLELKEGDRLTTADGASAIVKLQDGTRMTVRPNSEIVLQQYQFKENASDNTMLLQMVRGGFRAVTGLISKSSPNAARVQTSTATIGIRGTDFDARLCARDCGNESAQIVESARPNAVLASAKIVQSSGSIYPGDVVETMPGSRAVLAFRDDSRVSLGSNTRFRVDNFVYDEKNANDGRFLVSLVRGTVRAVTGLIGKANVRNVAFSTSTATIGIRGTDIGIGCEPDCSNLNLWTFLGSMSVQQTGQTALQLLQAGQGLFISPSGVVPINTPPAALTGPDVPPPADVPVPPKIFATQQVSDAQEGLFVFVRDGHIEVATASEVLHLGRGEAGFAGLGGDTARPTNIPKFIDFDRLPLPNARNPLLVSVLGEAKIASKTCN